MAEFKDTEERPKAEGEGIREEKHDPSAAKHEQMPEVSSDSTPSILKPVFKNNHNIKVHYHGHAYETKKWKEYVFQFFMLFLLFSGDFWQRIN